jgi:O-antigen ligase
MWNNLNPSVDFPASFSPSMINIQGKTTFKPLRFFLNFCCIALLLVYLTFVPGGKIGFALVLFCFLIKLALSPNMLTVGVYLLLFGMKTLGLVTLVFGYPGLGGKLSFIFGFFLLFLCTEFRKNLVRLQKPFLFIFWVFFVLSIFYLMGPQTGYSFNKLISVLVTGTISLFVFYLLIYSRSINWQDLGQLGILSAILCYGAIVVLEPQVKPSGMFDFGAMRLSSYLHKDVFDIRNLIGGLAIIGFTLNYSANPDRPYSHWGLIQLGIYSLAGMITLFWGGARLPIVTVVGIVGAMTSVNPVFRFRYRAILILISILMFTIFIHGIYKNIYFITSVVEQSRSFGSRLNRDTNWDAGFRRIVESPIIGHGLGGYYIEGYSKRGEGTYAHNLILELLSETGVVGTLLVFSPLLWWFKKAKKFSIRTMRAKNYAATFPLMLVFFFQSMISFDLTTNIALFSIIAVVLMVRENNFYRFKLIHKMGV